MPGEALPRRKADPEDAMRAYFRNEIAKAEAGLPWLPALTTVSASKAVQAAAARNQLNTGLDRAGSGFRGNLASLFLAACILGTAAIALSCSPRTALASSIGQAVEGQGLEMLAQDTIKLAGFVWRQGQEYFGQKHSGIVGAAGKPALEKENL